MNKIQRGITLAVLGLVGAAISSAQTVVPKGTDVDLKFMQRVDSRHIHVGDTVKLAVAKDVYVAGKDVLHAGMPVTAVVEKVDHRDHFGKNARIRLALNPVRTHGGLVYLEPRDKQSITGRRSDTAAAASAGGAVILGPVGLIGGYFVVGKPVKVQVGDPMYTSVSRTVTLRA